MNVGGVNVRSPASGHFRSMAATAAMAIGLCVCGCAGGGGKRACSKPQEYQASETTASLTVPNSLDEPDRSGKLVIPEARQENEGADAQSEQPCLDQPPDYFDRKL